MKIRYMLTIGILCFTLVACATDDIAQAYYSIANAYYNLEDYPQAQEYYLKAWQLKNILSEEAFNYARLSIIEKQYAVGIDILQKLLKSSQIQNTPAISINNLLAYAYLLQEDYDSAQKTYQTLADTMHQSTLTADTYFNWGLSYYFDKKYDQADTLFIKAIIRSNDEDKLAIYYRGLIALQKKDFTSAIEYFSIIDETDDIDQTEYLYNRARAYEGAQLYIPLAETYEKLLLLLENTEKTSILLTVFTIYTTHTQNLQYAQETIQKLIAIEYNEITTLKKLIKKSSKLMQAPLQKTLEQALLDAKNKTTPPPSESDVKESE